MGSDLFVIIFMYPDFREPMAFVETLCIVVRHLNMEVDFVNLWFRVCGSRGENEFQALRTQVPRAVGLRYAISKMLEYIRII